MSKRFLYIMLVGMMAVLGMGGCSETNEDATSLDQSLYSVKELLQLDAAKVKSIQVVYGDGTRMVLDSKQDIEPIIKRVEPVQAKRMTGNEEPGQPGFLFYMDVMQGEQEIRVASEFEVNRQSYTMEGPELNELNRYMVELGRSHNPELLPGYTISE
ncbi:hypothetical protein [Paenibacillus solani]|uniref:Lipoprotein n=1 Tax=Paenibacillus solani TaxID=1705565 RepID=A0A0M1N2F3_9BACL|nr:hypothetical protein [Paenibacillus solani]KOR76154.1 hypothetical protein AM231_26355 [Paenibacillus solani]